LKSIDLIPREHINKGNIYIIDNVILLSDLVESSEYSLKTIFPYAPLDKFYGTRFAFTKIIFCLTIYHLVKGIIEKNVAAFHFQPINLYLYSLFKAIKISIFSYDEV